MNYKSKTMIMHVEEYEKRKKNDKEKNDKLYNN
jgi:hypothetical protein